MAKYSVSYIYEIVDKYSATAAKIKRSTDRMKDSAKRAAKGFQDMGKKMMRAGAVMSAAVSLPILLLGRSMINAASDAEETRSKFEFIFKDIGDKANKSAKAFADSFGLANSTAQEMISYSGDILTGIGFTQDAALGLSLSLSRASQDLVSFKNFSGGASEANAVLTKALLGEREALASLGMKISEVDVKKKMSILRSEGNRYATQNEAKAQATLVLIMERSKNAIGDYERTRLSYANTTRRVSENNKKIAETLGKILIPIVLKGVLVIEKLQSKFISLSPEIKKIVTVALALAAVIGPLVLGLGAIALLLPMIATGFAVLFGPISLIIGGVALFALGLRHLYKNSDRFRSSVNALGSAVGSVFNGIMSSLQPVIDAFNFLNNGAFRIASSLFGNDTNINVAAQGAANQNTLNGNIDITANGAKVNSASMESSAPGNLGTNVGGVPQAPIRY